MKRSFNLSGLCLSALIAPGLSLIFVLVAALGLTILDWVMSASDAGVSLASAGHVIVTLAAMILLVTLWGLLPSIMFGAAGCWVAERYLRSKAWWAWGLAGLTASAAYVAAAVACGRLSSKLSFLFAPWLFVMEQGQTYNDKPVWPWNPTLIGVVAALLAAGFVAGSLYFRLSRGGWSSKRADKRA